MTLRKAKLRLDPAGMASAIEIDGHKLPGVHKVAVTAAATELTTLTIDLSAYEIEIDGVMQLLLPSSTRESLIALGWTPPADEGGES